MLYIVNIQEVILYSANTNYNIKKNVGNHFVYVFQASPKRLSYFERVMFPRYAQASIFTLVAFFNLGDFGKQD